MKKINTKKLNQFYMSGSNSSEMKTLVQNAVIAYTSDDAKANPVIIALLDDLGLLTEM